MTVENYLRALGINTLKSYISLSFVIGKVEDEGIGSTWMYRNSPIRNVRDWFKSGLLDEYIVLNTEQPTIGWLTSPNNKFMVEKHREMSLLVTTLEDMHKAYPSDQGTSLITYIDSIIIEKIDNKSNPWIQHTKDTADDTGILEVSSREEAKIAQVVRRALSEGRTVIWTSDYETFYGVGWEKWAEKQVEDIPCTIEIMGTNTHHGFVDKLRIIPNKK